MSVISIVGYLFGFVGFIPMYLIFISAYFKDPTIIISINTYHEAHIEMIALTIGLIIMIYGAILEIKNYLRGDIIYEKENKT